MATPRSTDDDEPEPPVDPMAPGRSLTDDGADEDDVEPNEPA